MSTFDYLRISLARAYLVCQKRIAPIQNVSDGVELMLPGHRYWTRKVIPEALPDPDKTSVENEMEKAANRRDLERDMDAAVVAAVHSPDDEPHEQKQCDLERGTKPLHRKTDELTH